MKASRQDFLKKYYPKFTEGGDFIKNPQGLALQGGFPAYSFVFKIKNRKQKLIFKQIIWINHRIQCANAAMRQCANSAMK